MNIVTIGGVTVGICIALSTLVQWWPGLKPLQKRPQQYLGQLLPFLLAWAYGVLAILTIGGIVGWIADTALWITSWLGDVALVWGVGGQSGQAATGGAYLPLTQTGSAVVLILTACMIAAAKKSKYGRDLKMGAWCGVALGTSAGVAGFAAVPLAQAANWLGLHAFGVIA